MAIAGNNNTSSTEYGPYSADTQLATLFTMPVDAIVSELHWKSRYETSAQDCCIVVYDSAVNAGKDAPNNVLGYAVIAMSGSSTYISATGLNIAVPAGKFWIKIISQNGYYFDADSGATDQMFAAFGRTGVSPFSFPTDFIEDPQQFTSEGYDAFQKLIYAVYDPAATAELEQEGFRFRNDDGSETGATWLQSQDTNVTQALNTNVRLRVLVDSIDDAAAENFTLYYKKSTDGTYIPVPVGAGVSEAYGTVTYQSIGTGANGGTSVAPSYPASIAAGDYLTLHVSSGGASNPTPSTPSGWTLLATGTSTDGAYGVDTGPRRMTVFGKIADGTESGTLSVTITGGNTCRGTIIRWTKAGSGNWDVEAFGSDDSTSGTGVSMTFSSMNWNTGDTVLVAVSQRVDSATQSAQSLTASGVTFGTRTNRATTAVTTGNDHRHVVDTFAAISSTSDVDAAPTWAYTASASVSAGGVIVRLREYTAPITNPIYINTSSNITAGGQDTTAQLTPPSGKTTGDFTTGRMWDDENGADSIDVAVDNYTELEWNIRAQSPAANSDIYQFRVYAGSDPLDTYTLTPEWAIGTPSGAPYTLAMSGGVFTLTGQSMSIRVARKMLMAQASFTLSGQAMLLKIQRKLLMSTGNIVLAGQTVLLIADRKLQMAGGSFALSGQDAFMVYGRTIGMDKADFTLTGNNANLILARLITLQTGSFALSGQPVAMKIDRKITMQQASFILSGQDMNMSLVKLLSAGSGIFDLTLNPAVVKVDRYISLEQSNFSINGQDIIFNTARVLRAIGTSFDLTGQDISLISDRKLQMGKADFTLNGQPVEMSKGFIMAMSNGVFVVTGNQSNLLISRVLSMDSGTFSLSGQSVVIILSKYFTMDTGYFTLAGQNMDFLRGYNLKLDAGTVSLNGQDVGMLRGLKMPIEKGDFTLTGQDVNFPSSNSIVCSTGIFSFSGITIQMLKTSVLQAETGDYQLQGQDASLLHQRVIMSEAGNFQLQGQDISILAARKLFAETGIVSITGPSINLLLSKIFSVDTGVITLEMHPAQILAARRLITEVAGFELTGQDAVFLYDSGSIILETGYFNLVRNNANLIRLVGINMDSFVGTAEIIHDTEVLERSVSMDDSIGYSEVKHETDILQSDIIIDSDTGSVTVFA